MLRRLIYRAMPHSRLYQTFETVSGRCRLTQQANRRAAPMWTRKKTRTGLGSCTALIDTWLQALLALKGDRREVA
jgi:hypothetical protein